MKKFYSVKNSNNNNNNNNNNNSSSVKSNLSASSNNLLDKLSKRYSGISSKFLRKTPGRKVNRDVVSGSYNMKGNQSDDHRPEIGLPILISKIDRTDLDAICPGPYSPTLSASDSENEVFVDADSSFSNFADIKFSFLPENTSSPNSSFDSDAYDLVVNSNVENHTRFDKIKSKSAQNLHRTELKIFLQRRPSLEAIDDLEENCYDFPKTLGNGQIQSKDSVQPLTSNSSLANEPPIVPVADKKYSVSILHQVSSQQLNKISGSQQNIQNSECQSITRDDSIKSNNSNKSIHNSSVNGEVDEFDFKSASLQSINEKNLFLSIEELNEITRQINESEDFNQQIDYEYCEHRDKLKPSERRITLLRNKESNKFINLNVKKEKIAKKWTGVKHWISEERGKFKDVVQRHAALQRVGGQGTRANSVETQSSLPNEDETSLRSADQRGESLSRSEISPTKSMSVLQDIEPQTNGSRKTSLQKSTNDSFEGQNNSFEELRRYVKQGGDFGRDLAAILQERVEVEQNYAKSLAKMATKLSKACREIPGTMAEAWRGVSTEMESRSEVHRQFSMSLSDEVVKPLKTILDNQHKSRKAIESNVEKAVRVLSEWRTAEIKGKKHSHSAARENERLQDVTLDARIQRSPSIAILPHNGTSTKAINEKETKEKDCVKLENKRKKAEEAVKRADVEYYTLCIRAERARVDWEIAILRGSSMLQSLENQRLSSFKEYIKSYHKLSYDMCPLIDQIVQRLEPHVNNCNVQKDLTVLKNIRRASEGPSEQLLPDFYCEHTTLAMNRERRKQSLVKLLQLIRQDLERERKSRNGLKGFSQSINSTDNQNITDKLYHIRSMLTYLEGARYKLQSALLELDHRPRGSHPLAQHIQITRDRTGLQQSILKVPLWLKNDENDNTSQTLSYDDIDRSVEAVFDSPRSETVVIECENERLVEKINAKNNMFKEERDINGKLESNKSDESPIFDRGVADGNSNQPDSDFDEFSSDEEGKSEAEKLGELQTQPVIIGRCKALYSYTPKLYDELELMPGDVIDVHSKQEDGWWIGALRNNVGIFPATYVEEIL